MKLNYKIVITILIAILALVGCNKEKNPLDNMLFKPSDNSVSFSSTPDNWGATKGDVINSNNFNNFDVYAYYTKDKEFSSADVELAPLMYNQKVERTKTDGSWSNWSYSPTKYWPNNDNDKISFFAFSPFNAISKPVTEQEENYPTFSYTHTSLSIETVDLLYSTKFNKTKPTDGSGVEFNMQRLMSRVNLYGGCINRPSIENYAKAGEVDVKYYISNITFFGVSNKIDYKYDETNSNETAPLYNWGTAQGKINYTASQGNVLKEIPSPNNQITDDNQIPDITENDFTTYTDVCKENKGILFLPQNAEDMTLQIIISKRYKKYVYDEVNKKYTTNVIQYGTADAAGAIVPSDPNYTGDAIFETVFESANDISVPTPNNKGIFESGDWINMYFTFDASRVSEDYIVPMTLFAKPYKWTEADVPSDIHKNIYIYNSKQDLEVKQDDTPVDFMICTNYAYSLLSPHSREELDGSTTTSRGFIFSDATKVTDTDPNDNTIAYKYRYNNKEFDLSITKSTRTKEGLYVSSVIGGDDSYGVNKEGTDPVYIFSLNIDYDELTALGEFRDVIGVEMISDGGGMITQNFPINVKLAAQKPTITDPDAKDEKDTDDFKDGNVIHLGETYNEDNKYKNENEAKADAILDMLEEGYTTIYFEDAYNKANLKNILTKIGEELANDGIDPADQTFSLNLTEVTGMGTDFSSGLFNDNDYINVIRLPSSVKVLKEGSFANCNNLTMVIIGSIEAPSEDADTIITGAFSNCTNLKTIMVYSKNDKVKLESNNSVLSNGEKEIQDSNAYITYIDGTKQDGLFLFGDIPDNLASYTKIITN